MNMRRFLCLIAVFAALVAVPVFGGEPNTEKHRGPMCSFEGAWIGLTGFGPFASEFVATSPQGGSFTVDWTGGTGSWFGLCDGSVRNSTAYGIWKRTGPRTIEYSGVTFSLDIEGNPVCIWKSSGWAVLDPGCNTGGIDGSVEIFAPDVNPFDGTPFYVIPAGTANPFMRMTVDPWVE